MEDIIQVNCNHGSIILSHWLILISFSLFRQGLVVTLHHFVEERESFNLLALIWR